MSNNLVVTVVSLLLPCFTLAADQYAVVDSFPLSANAEAYTVTGDTVIIMGNSEYQMYRADNSLKSQDAKHSVTPMKSGHKRSFDAIKAANGKLFLLNLKDETIYESKDNLTTETPACQLSNVLTNAEKLRGEKLDKYFACDGLNFYFVVLAGWSSRVVKHNPLSGRSESVGYIEGIPSGLDFYDNKVWYLGRQSVLNSEPLLLEYSVVNNKVKLNRSDLPCEDAQDLVVNKDGIWVVARGFLHHIGKK